ncbi:hypothetical protein ACS0TY_006395 [Phlomoides rotata]
MSPSLRTFWTALSCALWCFQYFCCSLFTGYPARIESGSRLSYLCQRRMHSSWGGYSAGVSDVHDLSPQFLCKKMVSPV